MTISLRKIVEITLVIFVLFVILMAFPQHIAKAKWVIELCDMIGLKCDDDLTGDIEVFYYRQGLGKKITLVWQLSKDPFQEDYKGYDITLSYNKSDGINHDLEGNFGPKNDVFSYEYPLETYEPHTFTLTVTNTNDQDLTPSVWEITVDLKKPFSRTMVDSFLMVTNSVENIVKSDTQTQTVLPGLKIESKYAIVGFNNADVKDICRCLDEGITDIVMPTECTNTRCLCMCKVGNGMCKDTDHLCFGLDNVDYFVGVDYGMNQGGEITLPFGQTHRSVLLLGGCCTTVWGTRDLTVSKTVGQLKTYIQLAGSRYLSS
ncbi:MAG: hypothetical protein ABIG95_05840 [Candidatus Woesearchaeota archaeon]